jgi:uncharacterized DUF497 family protein
VVSEERDVVTAANGLTFEWGAQKASNNLAKHGVSFHDAATAFGDPLSITIGDPAHSNGEQRFLLIGRASNGKVVVVVHVERRENRLRLISARPATRRELKDYEHE